MFTALTKFDGTRMRQLNAREFHQIAGRAGRAGYDTAGTVVAQAPEHESENIKAIEKAGDDPKKRRKIVRKKAPEGFVSWGEPSFRKLIDAEPETLTSSHADHERDAHQHHRPRGRRLRARALAGVRQPRTVEAPARARPPGARAVPLAPDRRRRRRTWAARSVSPSTCSRTSPSTSRCRRSRSPRSSSSTSSRRSTRSTSSRWSRRPSTTRVPCCRPSSSRRAARPSRP